MGRTHGPNGRGSTDPSLTCALQDEGGLALAPHHILPCLHRHHPPATRLVVDCLRGGRREGRGWVGGRETSNGGSSTVNRRDGTYTPSPPDQLVILLPPSSMPPQPLPSCGGRPSKAVAPADDARRAAGATCRPAGAPQPYGSPGCSTGAEAPRSAALPGPAMRHQAPKASLGTVEPEEGEGWGGTVGTARGAGAGSGGLLTCTRGSTTRPVRATSVEMSLKVRSLWTCSQHPKAVRHCSLCVCLCGELLLGPQTPPAGTDRRPLTSVALSCTAGAPAAIEPALWALSEASQAGQGSLVGAWGRGGRCRAG